MYQSLTKWRDLTDDHLYQQGDSFPYDGREIPAERINALMSGKNRAGIALITAVEPTDGQSVKEKGETPRKANRSRKKAI